MTSRTAKGEARRAALLDAAIRLLEREGPSGVTHRAVAAEAGVPLAAATYYFAGIDDLLVAALRLGAERCEAAFTALPSGDLRAAAVLLHEYAHAERAASIAQYELVFLAMRREALRADAQRWYRTLETLVARLEPEPELTDLVCLAIDGLLLRMLWTGEPDSVEGVEAALRSILSGGTAPAGAARGHRPR